MALAHHRNVTLVPFCLHPPFLSPYLLYFLFSCSASNCWQLFLSISLPPSLFLNPALIPAPLLRSLSLLFQAFQPNTSYFPFHLHRGRNPEDRDTSCFILQENSIFHPMCAAGASTAGWTEDVWGVQRGCRPGHVCPCSCSVFANDYGLSRSCPFQHSLGQGSCLGCGVPPSSPTITTLLLRHENTPFFVEAKPPAVSPLKYFASNIKGSCLKHPAVTPFPAVSTPGPAPQGSPAGTSAVTGLGPGALWGRGTRHKGQEPAPGLPMGSARLPAAGCAREHLASASALMWKASSSSLWGRKGCNVYNTLVWQWRISNRTLIAA